MTQPMSKLLRRLWRHVSPRRRRQFGLVLVLMIFASFAEIISIGAVLPFLGVLTAPDRVFELPVTQPIIELFDLKKPEQLLFPLTAAFCVAALLAGAMRILLLWASTRLSFATGADLSISVYRRTLYQPYAVHIARNSSEIINGISNKTRSVTGIMSMLLNIIGSVVMLISILIAMLSVDLTIALVIFGGFGLIYASIIKITRKRLLLESQCMSRESSYVIKSLQEGLGGIRDVLIDGTQDAYCQIYRNADLPFRRAQGNVTIISASPRYVIEALGMMLIALLAFTLAQESDGIAKAMPVLGALAIGIQRLLPILQLAYSSWSGIQGGQSQLQDALDLLDQPLPAHADHPVDMALAFNQHICLSQLSFKYSPQAPWVIRSINLTIVKGSRIGFIGATGSGKSTLLDIVMGLLQPTRGAVEIDGQPITIGNQRAWQAHVAHVPQTIFLADSTIEENIAFGIPTDQIDRKRIRKSAEQAQIASSIEILPKQYQTVVGERGVRLSGGQRQRLGIARALYKQADVIIFDEATSALDTETEKAVMHAIESLSQDLTLLIIAHRLTTLKNCTQIVELADGGIKRIGSYQEIMNQVI
jgi:ABC-type multidrug transport system fused ATPase/permease subunit